MREAEPPRRLLRVSQTDPRPGHYIPSGLALQRATMASSQGAPNAPKKGTSFPAIELPTPTGRWSSCRWGLAGVLVRRLSEASIPRKHSLYKTFASSHQEGDDTGAV